MKTAQSRLLNEKIPKLVLSYALTTLVALLLNSVFSLTDALFVSWGVGATASGGISVVMPFVLIQSAISTTLGGGAATLVSIKFGEGKLEEAGEITKNAFFAFYTTAIAVTVLGFLLMEPLLKIMGVTGDLYAYSKEYFIIILAGNVFSTGFSSIIRAEGKMLYGLLIWVIPISVNIILDAVFILVLDWGVRGSALATVICQFVSFLMMVLFFLKFSKQVFKKTKIKLSRLLSIIKIGLPSLVQIGSMSIVIMVINYVLSKAGGTLGINTFAFVSKLITFAIVPFTALTQAVMPIIGFNYGAKEYGRIKQTTKFALAVAIAYAIIATALAEAIPSYLMRIFTDDTEIIAMGSIAIRLLSASLVLTPLPLILGAVFQAEGKRISLLLYSLTLIFLLPFVFTLYLPMSTNGIWLSYVIASGCATIVAIVIYYINRKAYSSVKTEAVNLMKKDEKKGSNNE